MVKTIVQEAQCASTSSIPDGNIQRFKERLTAIIPTVSDLISKTDHKIGVSEYDEDMYEDNQFYYEADGLTIDIEYRCCGKWYDDPGDYWTPPCDDLKYAWGEISSISSSFYDEETDELYNFTQDDLKEFRDKINNILESIY